MNNPKTKSILIVLFVLSFTCFQALTVSAKEIDPYDIYNMLKSGTNIKVIWKQLNIKSKFFGNDHQFNSSPSPDIIKLYQQYYDEPSSDLKIYETCIQDDKKSLMIEISNFSDYQFLLFTMDSGGWNFNGKIDTHSQYGITLDRTTINKKNFITISTGLGGTNIGYYNQEWYTLVDNKLKKVLRYETGGMSSTLDGDYIYHRNGKIIKNGSKNGRMFIVIHYTNEINGKSKAFTYIWNNKKSRFELSINTSNDKVIEECINKSIE